MDVEQLKPAVKKAAEHAVSKETIKTYLNPKP
jgi:hypothetical protein